MFFVYVAGLVILLVGLRAGPAGLTAVGAGIVCVAWGGLMAEERLVEWYHIWRLRAALPRLERFFREESATVAQARPLCRIFARHYPVYLRCPYRLDERGHVKLARSRAERRILFRGASLPPLFTDLANILAEEGIHFPALEPLVLLVNQEVMEQARERLRGGLGDLAGRAAGYGLWAWFVRFEADRAVEWGGLTLYWREALADVLMRDADPRWIAQDKSRLGARTANEWIDRSIREGRESILRRSRANRLRALLQEDEVNRGAVRPWDAAPQERFSVAPLTVRELGLRANEDIAGVAKELRDVFAAGSENFDESALDGREDRLAQGYFLARSEGRLVLFQVGQPGFGTTDTAAVDRAFVHKMRENADQAVLLALGPIAPDAVRRADSIGILVLPPEALDRLLAYHTDRIWQTVDWSLRVASLSKNIEADNVSVEIG